MTTANGKPKNGREKPDLIDRQPPFDLAAEAGVLGSVILLPAVLEGVSELISPEDFYDDANAVIYAAMLALRHASRGIDGTTLVDRLKATGQWEKSGGAKNISRIVASVAVPAHAVFYAEIVAEKAVLRRLIMAATEILKDAYDEADEAGKLVEKAEGLIAGVAGRASSRFEIKSLHAAGQKVISRIVAERESGIPINRAGWGLATLDDTLGPIMGGEVCIIAARPGLGKTAFVQHGLRLAPQPTLLISIEMTAEEIASRELCRIGQVDSRFVRDGSLGPADMTRLRQAGDELDGLPVWIWDPYKTSMAQIRQVVRHAYSHLGVRTVAIDYIQLVDGDEKNRDQRREQLAKIARELKQLAKGAATPEPIPLFVCCQLNRFAENEVPTMAMLRECGTIEESADVVLLISDLMESGEGKKRSTIKLRDDRRHVIVGKFKQGRSNVICELAWNNKRTEFGDLDAAARGNYEPLFDQQKYGDLPP